MTTIKNVPEAAAWVTQKTPGGVIDGLPGLALVGTLALASIALARIPWLSLHGIGSMTLAILLGIAFGNTAYAHVAGVSQAGMSFSKQTLLRAGFSACSERRFHHRLSPPRTEVTTAGRKRTPRSAE
jgi:hypothetical protein